MAVFKTLWRWLNKHEVISGLFVTILGVWIAFWLTGLGEQSSLDRVTKQRLHLAVLEAQYNIRDANEILNDYAEAVDPNRLKVNVRRLNSTAATAAFCDAHILSLLPLHKVSLLNGYMNEINLLNQTLQMHQGVLESQGYKTTSQEREFRQKVCDNAAGVIAMAKVLEEEFSEYFDANLYDQCSMEAIRNRVQSIKEENLKGEAPFPKKEQN
jgi:hypothetical protein